MHLEMLSLMIMAVKLWRTADFLSDNRYGGHLRVVVYIAKPDLYKLGSHQWRSCDYIYECCR